MQPDDSTVARERTVFVGDRDITGLGLRYCGQHILAVLLMDLLEPQLWIGHPLLGGKAQDGLNLWADVERAAVLVERSGIDDGGKLLDECSKTQRQITARLCITRHGPPFMLQILRSP